MKLFIGLLCLAGIVITTVLAWLLLPLVMAWQQASFDAARIRKYLDEKL